MLEYYNKEKEKEENMKLQKKKKLIVLLFLIVFSCSGCRQETNQEEGQEENLSHLNEDTFRIQADLTHTGLPETIITSVYEVPKDSKEPAIVEVESHGSDIIWKKEIFLDNSSETSGEDAYFLCNIDGESCLMYYNPCINEENARYSYRVFYLEQDGSEITIAENSISFDIAWKENMNFPVDDMVIFAEEINQYMGKAYILISTIEGELSYSTLDGMEIYKESYQSITESKNISDSEELRKKLNEYKNRLEENNL